MEGTMAVVTGWGAYWAPRNWQLCYGQLLPISTNQALFSLLGTTYGGDGTTTFGLPDLRGRAPVGTGNAPGISPVNLGQKMGTESVTITSNNLPPHNHSGVEPFAFVGNGADGSLDEPANAYPGAQANAYSNVPSGVFGNVQFTGIVGNQGGGIPVYNMQPFLAINYIICTVGIFPSRS